MVTGQMIYNWLLRRHVLYISMIYLSLLIHILVGTRLRIKKKNRKNTSPPHFPFRNPIVYKAFREGGVQQRGHSTPHLTPPSFYSASILFLNILLLETWWRRKSEKKVTCWVRCWVRCLPNTSLSETLVNKGILSKKVRWWGLFWNSLKLTELSTWPGLCSRLHEKGVKKATKLQRYRNIYYLCSEAK